MLEQIAVEGQGFRPLKDHGSWRIAQLGYDPAVNAPESLAVLGRHLATEEAFLLLQGRAVMVTAGNLEQPGSLEAVRLAADRIYVVGQGQWHAAVLSPGARLLIVENSDTGAANSEDRPLSTVERLELRACIARAQDV